MKSRTPSTVSMSRFETETQNARLNLSVAALEDRDIERLNIKSFEYRNQLIVASEYVLSKLGQASIAIVLGSGLGGFSDRLKNVCELNYNQVPFLPTPTVKGHSGKIIMGDIIDEKNSKNVRRVMCFAGRLHAYEGYPMYQVVFCARLAFLVGCHTMILTNSSGGCIPNQRPGSVVILKDYIRDVNYHVLNHSANDAMFGRRHLPGTKTIDQSLASILGKVAEDVKFPYYYGTYWYVMGPSYETSSQVKHIIKLGGSCVGMSTVPSILASANIGLRTCCLALCTNVAAGLSDEPLNHSVVVREANLAKQGFGDYVEACILRINDPGPNSSMFNLNLTDRINYVTENNNGIVWDSELYKRVNLGTYKNICRDIMYIRSFLGNILFIQNEEKKNDDNNDNNTNTNDVNDNNNNNNNNNNKQQASSVSSKRGKMMTPVVVCDSSINGGGGRGRKKNYLISNREGPIPIWILQHPFTMNISKYDMPIAFPLKTLYGWTRINVSSSATEAVLYFMLDVNKNLIVTLQGLQLEGLSFIESNYIINLIYGVIGHKNLYFLNVFTAFDTFKIYGGGAGGGSPTEDTNNEEKDTYWDNNDNDSESFEYTKESTVISNKFALIQDWFDCQGGQPSYPWPLFPPTDENTEDTKVMFKYGFFGDLNSESFTNCKLFLKRNFNNNSKSGLESDTETQALSYAFWPGPNLPSRAEVNITKRAKCELIGITDPIVGNMCRQLGCDGYSIAAVATQEDIEKITHKEYGYGTTDTKYRKDITKMIDNFNRDLLSFFNRQKVYTFSPASVSRHTYSRRGSRTLTPKSEVSLPPSQNSRYFNNDNNDKNDKNDKNEKHSKMAEMKSNSNDNNDNNDNNDGNGVSRDVVLTNTAESARRDSQDYNDGSSSSSSTSDSSIGGRSNSDLKDKHKNSHSHGHKHKSKKNKNYDGFEESADGPDGTIIVNKGRLEKIANLNLPLKQPNYQILFNVEKEWIAVEEGARWLEREWDFNKFPCKNSLMSTFSHVYDLCEIQADYSVDLSRVPHWRGHLCGGFQLSHYHWNSLNPFEWTLKILKNPIKNVNTNNNEYYILIAPNFFNNKEISKERLRYMAAFYKYTPLFWNLMFILRVLWKVGVKNIVFLSHLHGCYKTLEEEKADLEKNPNKVVCINNYVDTARWSCLTGPNDERMGPRFVPITEPMEYEETFIDIAKNEKFGFKKDIPSVLTVHTSNYGTISSVTKQFYGCLGYQTLNCGLVSMVIAAQHVGLKKACVGIVDYDIGKNYSNVESFEQVFKMIETLFSQLKLEDSKDSSPTK